MSVHQLGGRGHHNGARIRGRSRSTDHQVRHSERMRQGAKDVRESRSERKAESHRRSRPASDSFDRAAAPSRSGRGSGNTTIIFQQNFYYDSDGSLTRLDHAIRTNETDEAQGERRSARSHRHHWDRMIRRPEDQNDVSSTDPSVNEETHVGDTPAAEEESIQLSPRHERRLNRISRQVDRMVAHGFGDRAVARLERQLERVESRIESGRMDSGQGKLYADSLRTMLSNLNDRLAPVDEATPVVDHKNTDQVDPMDAAEMEAQTAYNNLTGKSQKWIRNIYSQLQRMESNGDIAKAIDSVNSRIEWAVGMSRKGNISADKSANLIKTLNYLASMLSKPESNAAIPEPGTAPTASGETSSMKVDWDRWSEGQTVPSETPMRDLPPIYRRWIHGIRKSAMKSLKLGDQEAAQATVQKSLDWLAGRMESGSIVPKHAANFKATLEKLMARISKDDAPPVPTAGANPIGSPTYTGDAIRVIEVQSQHRTHMYSYASRQYGLAS